MMKQMLFLGACLVAGDPAFADGPIVIAHRGASGYLPEHTLAAKALAHAQGADYLEQDVVLTRDGVPIVSHDIHLDRVTDVATRFPGRARKDSRFYAIDFDWSEIQQLRVMERFNEKGAPVYPGRFPSNVALLRVVSLEEELAFIQGLNRSTGRTAGIYLELKQPGFHRGEGQDLSSIVLNVLNDSGYKTAADGCILQCFEDSEVQRLRKELKTELPLILLISESRDWQELLKSESELETRLKVIATYAHGIGPSLPLVISGADAGKNPVVTPLVAAAHRAGLAVHAWTFRADQLSCGAEDFEQLHRWGQAAELDGYFTDFPDKTVQFLRKPAP